LTIYPHEYRKELGKGGPKKKAEAKEDTSSEQGTIELPDGTVVMTNTVVLGTVRQGTVKLADGTIAKSGTMDDSDLGTMILLKDDAQESKEAAASPPPSNTNEKKDAQQAKKPRMSGKHQSATVKVTSTKEKKKEVFHPEDLFVRQMTQSGLMKDKDLCGICAKNFSVFRKRLTCESCQKEVCPDCSSFKRVHPDVPTIRICVSCNK